MGFYDRHVLPRLIDAAMSQNPIRRQRQKVVPLAEGRVLEVGMGSGLNLPHYDPAKVREVIGLDPSAGMAARAAERIAASPVPVSLIGLSGEAIPLEDQAVDTVLFTYTLCTIPDPVKALGEMRRVLKPGGRLIFCEHGRAPDAAVRRWQDWINPIWRPIGGGCNLNRDVPALLGQGGFAIEGLETMYLPGPRPMTFNYWGTARPR